MPLQNLCQESVSSSGAQKPCGLLPECQRIVARTCDRDPGATAPIRVEHHGVKGKLLPSVGSFLDVARPGTQGKRASPFKLGEDRPLGENRAVRGGIVQRSKQFPGCCIIVTTFDRQGPLPDRGQKHERLEALGNVMIEPQPVQPSPGEHDGVELAVKRLTEPGIDVAAEGHHSEIRTQV